MISNIRVDRIAGLFTRLITIDTWSMLVWRGVFGAAGILLVILMMQGGRTWGEFRRMGWAGWMFEVVSAFGMLCFVTSLRITTVAHVSIIYATVPLAAAGLAWLVMRERPAKSAIAASLMAAGGVSVMVGWGQEGDVFGDLLAFGMTVSLAIMMVISRHTKDIPIMSAACLSAASSSLAAVPWAGDLAVGAQDLVLLALFGLVNSALGLGLFSVGARMLPAVETALLGALDAPLAPIWVWIAFAETPGPATIIGGESCLPPLPGTCWPKTCCELQRPRQTGERRVLAG